MEQTNCVAKPDLSCTTETVSAAQLTTCETACNDSPSCQMYIFKDDYMGTQCKLYTCQLCHPVGKNFTNELVYFCSPGTAQQPHLTYSCISCSFVYDLVIKIISRYKKIGYNIIIFQQTACLVVNPITVGNFAFLFN